LIDPKLCRRACNDFDAISFGCLVSSDRFLLLRAAGPCTYASVSAQGAIGNKSLSLYQVEEDESERHNLTDAEPATVARLQALLQSYTATGVPQCTDKLCGDPSCPKPAVKKSPEHGWYWEPWCS
jgi:hypothetical protein